MNCISRELTVEMIVGTFVASIVVALAVFTIVLSHGSLGPGDIYEITIHFESVTGLREHDDVVVRGMPIGSIEALELTPDGVDVTARVEEKLDMRKGYTITIVPSSALGGHFMEIYEGPNDGEPVALTETFEGLTPSNLMEDAAELVSSIRNSLVNEGVLDNLKLASENVARITSRLESGDGTLGKLLSSDTEMYGDISTLLANVRKVSDRLEAGKGTLGRLLGEDNQLYEDMSTSIASIRKIAERVERGEGTVGRLLAPDDKLYDDAAATVAGLREIAERIEKGEGTLGALLAEDDKLYADLKDTIGYVKEISRRLAEGEGLMGELLAADSSMNEQVNGLLMDARATIDDFRESSPVVNFTSIFFGAF